MLFENLITGIDINGQTVEENSRIIRQFADKEWLFELSQRARERFFDVVNYDEEQKEIEKFIERLR
jgi:intein-encoded DNA endonuclease-like protein